MFGRLQIKRTPIGHAVTANVQAAAGQRQQPDARVFDHFQLQFSHRGMFLRRRFRRFLLVLTNRRQSISLWPVCKRMIKNQSGDTANQTRAKKSCPPTQPGNQRRSADKSDSLPNRMAGAPNPITCSAFFLSEPMRKRHHTWRRTDRLEPPIQRPERQERSKVAVESE